MTKRVTALLSPATAVRMLDPSRRSLCDGPCDDPVGLDECRTAMTYCWMSGCEFFRNLGDVSRPVRRYDCDVCRARLSRGDAGAAIDFGSWDGDADHHHDVYGAHAKMVVDCGSPNGCVVDADRGNGCDWAIAGIVADHRDDGHRESATFPAGGEAVANGCACASTIL